MNLATVTIALLIAYVTLYQYVFRFQRTTRGITQMVCGAVRSDVQIALTPTWVGTLGWLSKLLILITAFMVWKTWSWVALGAFFLYAFALGAVVDVLSPFPSHAHCFRIIEKGLKADGQAELLEAVRGVRAQYLD